MWGKMGIETFLIEEAVFSGLPMGKRVSNTLVGRYRRMQRFKKAISEDESKLIERLTKLQARYWLEHQGIWNSLNSKPLLGSLVRLGNRIDKTVYDFLNYLFFIGQMPDFVRVAAYPSSSGHCSVILVLDYKYGTRQLTDSYEIATTAKRSIPSAIEFLRREGYSIGAI